ncbi:MAG: hypothetical protein KAQ92_02980 [Candidatus Aenigmarchaeota archaeon]|nr:hypothetical protein [Candidatus Aenigmarchaeota archaeon]
MIKTLNEKINGYDPITQIVVRGDVKEFIRDLKKKKLIWLKKNVNRLDALRYSKMNEEEYDLRCETILKNIIKELKEFVYDIDKLAGKELSE